MVERKPSVKAKPKRKKSEERTLDYQSVYGIPRDVFMGMFAGTPTAGEPVNCETALRYTAVYACVRVIAESVASLPLIVYETLPNGGKQRAVNHPLYSLLHDEPNPYMSSFTVRETLLGHLLTWGNAYAEIERLNNGRIKALYPISPARVSPKVSDGVLRYDIMNGEKGNTTLEANEIVHIPGLGFDGIIGYSPIEIAKQAISLGLSAEKYGATFYANGANVGSIFSHPAQLNDKARVNLLNSLSSYRGSGNAHKTLVLEEGMKWERLGLPNDAAQFIETRKFQVEEIARLYRVPPHMIGQLDRATFSNIEQQSIDFTTNTLRPWLVRIEQELNRKLLLNGEKGKYFIEHKIDGLLRGDTAARYAAYAIARQWGWMSANDCRELEGLNHVDGGDIYLTPMNMVAAGTDAETAEEEQGEAVDANRGESGSEAKPGAFRGLFLALVSRLLTKQEKATANASTEKREAFYSTFGQHIAQTLEPAIIAYTAGQDLQGLAKEIATRIAVEWIAEARSGIVDAGAMVEKILNIRGTK